MENFARVVNLSNATPQRAHTMCMCSHAPESILLAGAHSQLENVDEDILQLGFGSSAVEIDLMQPLDSAKSPKYVTSTL